LTRRTRELARRTPAGKSLEERREIDYISRAVRDYFVRPVAILLWLAGSAFATCTNPISANPSSISFGNVGIGLGLYAPRAFTLTNSCSQTVKINSFTFSSPVFGMADGVLPRYIDGNSTDNWSVAFIPAAAQIYSGTLTINIAGFPPVAVNLAGTGIINGGVPTLTSTAGHFGKVPIGTTVTKNYQLTNNGTDAFILVELNTYAPFQVTPIKSPVAITPGQTFKFTVSYTATALGPITGAVTLVYNYQPAQGIDLTATGVAPSSLALASFPVLPAATQGSPYLATLQATGGAAPYTFHITKGSIPGLTFTPSTGTFGGSVSSSVAVGSYKITVQVTDSSQPQKQANATITLPVGPQTGANCSIIDYSVQSSLLTALNDLGTGSYLGYQGGLYPNGSNTDSSTHHSDGMSIGQAIQPRDADGTIDPANGSIVLMSLGMSNTQQPWIDFTNVANGDPGRNPRVAIVNGALGGETATELYQASSGYLGTILNYILPFHGYTAQQVAVVWIDSADSTTQAFPTDAQILETELEGIVATLKVDFPNLAVAYFGAVNYTGYAQGVSTVLPEPFGYDTAYGDKWAIQDQINGVCCNYNPANGTVVAPWMGWGYYYWANGLLARQDGTYWGCQDDSFDGTHPVYPGGHLKIAYGLLNFLKTDPTATPWFLAPGQ